MSPLTVHSVDSAGSVKSPVFFPKAANGKHMKSPV